MNKQTAKSKNDYSRNFKCLSFVLFPFYDSYHRLCCVTLSKDIAACLKRYIC